MKFLLSLFILLTPAAHAATLEIANESSLRADIGAWKGVKVPSICEDFKPCWEEVNQKFRPFPGLSNIRGMKSVALAVGSVTSLKISGPAERTFEIHESCRSVPREDLGMYFQLNGEANLTEVKTLSICLV
ncbi:MAG: hypothetical protein EOP11_09035, partial [Proteobacteria bacterium]